MSFIIIISSKYANTVRVRSRGCCPAVIETAGAEYIPNDMNCIKLRSASVKAVMGCKKDLSISLFKVEYY